MSIVMLCGSKKPAVEQAEKRSACRELLKIAVAGVREGGGLPEICDIRELILPWFDGRELQDYHNQDLNSLGNSLLNSEGIVISLPAYWRGVGGAVKNVFDLIGGAAYEKEGGSTILENKIIAMIIVGGMTGDSTSALEQMESIIKSMGGIPFVHHVLIDNPRQAVRMENTVRQAFALGRRMAEYVKERKII